MKILHVLSSPRAEGTPRIVLDWLTVKGYEQELVFLSPDGELTGDFKRHPVWQHFNNNFDLRVKNFIKIIQLIKNVCSERKPDIVIAWPLGFSHWIALGARKGGVHKIISHAGNPVGQGFVNKFLHTWISIGIGTLAGTKIIACSEYVKRTFLSIPFLPHRRFFSVYNCCRVENFLSSADHNKDNVAIMVATLEKHKDHETLLRAWHLLKKNNVYLPLFIVGNGTLRKDLQSIKDSAGLHNVEFLGARTDVSELLKDARYFVFSTTHQEGFGTVMVEALAAKCQIIASRVPATEELLQGGKYGVLVRPGDPTQLADAIIEALNRQIPVAAIEDGVKYAMTFSPESMIKQYIAIAST